MAQNNETTASRLLAVAAALFREKGFAATSTRELSDRLGIQNSSLYHHIRSKDDLLYSISMESLDHMTAAALAVINADSYHSATADERLRLVMRAHLMTALTDRDMQTTMLTEMRALPRDRREEVIAYRSAYERIIRGIVADAQTAGEVRADADPRYLTLALLNLLNWSIFWYDEGGQLSVHELADLLATVYLEGVLTGSGPMPTNPSCA